MPNDVNKANRLPAVTRPIVLCIPAAILPFTIPKTPKPSNPKIQPHILL